MMWQEWLTGVTVVSAKETDGPRPEEVVRDAVG